MFAWVVPVARRTWETVRSPSWSVCRIRRRVGSARSLNRLAMNWRSASEIAGCPEDFLGRDIFLKPAPDQICGSGYRSSIAASLLQSKGYHQLQNVMGGMGAYVEANCPAFEPAELVYEGSKS